MTELEEDVGGEGVGRQGGSVIEGGSRVGSRVGGWKNIQRGQGGNLACHAEQLRRLERGESLDTRVNERKDQCIRA